MWHFLSRPTFLAPDAGENKTPYCCTILIIPIGENILVIDPIRAEYTSAAHPQKTLCLRVFRVWKNGSVQGFVHEAPLERWAPFITDERNLPASGDYLGRGENWVAGRVTPDPKNQTISDVEFHIQLKPAFFSQPLPTGRWELVFLQLAATDFLKVSFSGTVRLGTEILTLKNNTGFASIHFGTSMPDYTAFYQPNRRQRRKALLLAIITGANLKVGRRLVDGLGGCVSYGYGSRTLPAFFLHIGSYSAGSLDLGGGNSFQFISGENYRHQFNGVDTLSGGGEAVFTVKVKGFLWWRLWIPGFSKWRHIRLQGMFRDLHGKFFTAPEETE